MSEALRKDFHTKAGEKLTPDSSKSTLDKTKESITGTGDKIARESQPDSEKTTAQSLGDKVGRTKDNSVHGSTHESIGDKVKGVFGAGKH
ncbi:hypothetical protein N0V95_000993 [Ascochyta clinopodiicola]|nr:hypothetical protein N0V95_000993 [Ascochyta clinopodiicola]